MPESCRRHNLGFLRQTSEPNRTGGRISQGRSDVNPNFCRKGTSTVIHCGSAPDSWVWMSGSSCTSSHSLGMIGHASSGERSHRPQLVHQLEGSFAVEVAIKTFSSG